VPDRFRIVWTRASIVDLDQIIDYVALDSGVDRALGLYEKIRDKIDSLSRLPRRGRIVPELESISVLEFREILMDRYRIIFRIDDKKVVLVGVFDGRRDLEAILVDRALRAAGAWQGFFGQERSIHLFGRT
jgi:toxin ParE1/3/4